MQRLNFTFDEATARLLEELAARFYDGNKSQTVRAALQALAAHAEQEGWVIAGYSPAVVGDAVACHTCGATHQGGDVLYRPVFERGHGPGALPSLPTEGWLDCRHCVEHARQS
ncbi:MAG: hypothetical protein U0232_14530 [Thermomicrobiales bacterium]